MDEKANELLTIDSAIKERTARIEKINEDIRPLREMVDSFLANDEHFAELSNVSKKANKEKNAYKKQLLTNPAAAEPMNKIKELRTELSEIKEALSYYLREYQRITGANEFEDADGSLRQIVYVAKLVKKSPFER